MSETHTVPCPHESDTELGRQMTKQGNRQIKYFPTIMSSVKEISKGLSAEREEGTCFG